MEKITIENLQSICDQFGGRCRSREITLDRYSYYMNLVENFSDEIRSYIKEYVGKRMRPRTFAGFARQIMVGTVNQDLEANWFVENHAHKHFKTPFVIESNGVDNTGCVIIVPPKDGKSKFTAPDYKVKDQPNFFLEHKNAPCGWKATYFKKDLESIENANAHTLTIHTEGRYEKAISFYTIMPPEVASRMLKELTIRKDYKGMRGLPAVMIADHPDQSGIGLFSDWLEKFYVTPTKLDWLV